MPPRCSFIVLDCSFLLLTLHSWLYIPGLRRYEQSLSDSLENGTLSRDSCLPINLQKEVIRADGSKFMRKVSATFWPMDSLIDASLIETITFFREQATGLIALLGWLISLPTQKRSAPILASSDLLRLPKCRWTMWRSTDSVNTGKLRHHHTDHFNFQQ